MQRQSLPCGPAPQIRIEDVSGDLQMAGWERPELAVKTPGDLLEVIQNGDTFVIRCDDDLIIYLPQGADVSVGAVGGDVDARGLSGALTLKEIGGDFQAHSLGALRLQNVRGDLNLRVAQGNCLVENIGGDASLSGISGQALLTTIAGDLYAREIGGELKASAGGDAVLFLTPREQTISVQAGGDILLRLPLEASATLSLEGGGENSVRVDFPGVTSVGDTFGQRQVLLGAGTAPIRLIAGGDLVVTSSAEEWQSMAEFGPDAWDAHDFPGIPPIPPIPPIPGGDLGARISSRIEAAGRRAEQKMRASEERTRAGLGVVIGGRRYVDFSPRPAEAPRAEPVSDQERLTILKMLAEKKISVTDAEKLLAALEGK